MDIGLQVRKERKQAGFTQEEIADILGWPPSKLSKIENNQQEITYREYLEFKEALAAQRIGAFKIDWPDHRMAVKA